MYVGFCRLDVGHEPEVGRFRPKIEDTEDVDLANLMTLKKILEQVIKMTELRFLDIEECLPIFVYLLYLLFIKRKNENNNCHQYRKKALEKVKLPFKLTSLPLKGLVGNKVVHC